MPKELRKITEFYIESHESLTLPASLLLQKCQSTALNQKRLSEISFFLAESSENEAKLFHTPTLENSEANFVLFHF